MPLRDQLVSLIRTFVPQAVAVGLAWLASKWGWTISDEWTAQLQFLAVEAVAGVYYVVIRLAESKIPWVGWLLGYATPPVYAPVGEKVTAVETVPTG